MPSFPSGLGHRLLPSSSRMDVEATADSVAKEGAVPPARILVADDERPNVDLVRGYLRGEGMTMVVAGDGPADLLSPVPEARARRRSRRR